MQTTRRTFMGCAAGAALCGLAGGPASAIPAAMVQPGAMRADLKLLRAVWDSIHPGLYRYNSRSSLDLRFAALDAWAGTARTPGGFFVALGRLSAALKCGHSYPNPVNQSEDVVAAFLDGRDRVPFGFRWIGGRMIVTDIFAPWGAGLAVGDEVVAIDGVAASRLLKALLPLARADGSNDDKRRALMEVRPAGRFQAFDVYRPLLFPPRRPGEVELAVRRGGTTRRLRVAAMSDAERQALFAAAASAEPWTFALAGGVGVLTMNDWALYNSKWDWRGFLDTSVDRLIDGGARALVVDIRDNEGGIDCGDVLLARLIERELTLPAYRRLTRYRTAPAELRPALDTWDKDFLDWGAAAIGPQPDGFYRLERGAADARTIAPNGRRFTGKVAVLGNAHNSSATFGFLQAVKQSRVATIVGEGSGGNQRGINGGAYFFVRLPETGLEMDVPIIGYFPEDARPDAGIAPDIAVALRPDDIAAGRDRVLDSAMRALAAGASLVPRAANA